MTAVVCSYSVFYLGRRGINRQKRKTKPKIEILNSIYKPKKKHQAIKIEYTSDRKELRAV